MARSRREDLLELTAELDEMRNADYEGSNLNGLARPFIRALETALNVMQNLADENAVLETRVKRLERDR